MQVNLERIVSAYSNTLTNNTQAQMAVNQGVCFHSFFEKGKDLKGNLNNNYDKTGSVTGVEDGDGNQKTTGYMTEDELKQYITNAIDTLEHLVKDEDYSKYAELGITAQKDDMKTIVTVYERIQIQLMAYGEGSATGLNISDEKIDKIIKSEALANGLKMADDIKDIDDFAKEYLIKNKLEPSVKNVYMAVHTSESEKALKELGEKEWEQLKPQIEAFLKKSGTEADSEAFDTAKWLISRDIPLTSENMTKYNLLSEIENADNRDIQSIKANMILARVFGMDETSGYMTRGWIDERRAKEVSDAVASVGEETVKYIVSHDLTLNAANIFKYENVKNDEDVLYSEEKYNHAMRVVYEAKQLLTVSGALTMEKLGVDIVHEEIENMVNMLKEEEDKLNELFLNNPTKESRHQMSDVMEIMKQMSSIPVAAVGKAVEGEEEFTIRNVYNEGIKLKNDYEAANITYEAVGTQIRPDLGDSILKAFNNIDELILEVGLEPTKEYKRAVRILGYNSMDVTKESVVKMAQKAAQVDKVIENITPKTAAYLIEHGINPLEEDIEKLNDMIAEINEETGATKNEEYSRYLWKLQKTGKITKEERDAYIELYRVLKTIEKKDARSIGAVIKEGAALTLGNLLQAEKSKSKTNQTITVDDNTGFYQGKLVKNRLTGIMENLAASKLQKGVEEVMEMPLTKLEDEVVTQANINLNKELESDYMASNLREIYKTIEDYRSSTNIRYTEEMLYEMLGDNTKQTFADVSAAAMLMTKGNEIRTMLKERIPDFFESEEDEEETLNNINNDIEKEIISSYEKGEKSQISYTAFMNISNFIVNKAKNKCYHIPMDLGDEEVLVKVKFHDTDEENKSKIEVKFDSTVLGSINANLYVADGKVEGYIICDNNETKKLIEENPDAFGNEEIKEKAVYVVCKDDSNIIIENEKKTSDYSNKYSNKQLYGISKSFLQAIKVWSGMPINRVD